MVSIISQTNNHLLLSVVHKMKGVWMHYRERLWREYEQTGELLVDLGSDQTSLHNPFSGGYYPVQLSFKQAHQLMNTDPKLFKTAVHERYKNTQTDKSHKIMMLME